MNTWQQKGTAVLRHTNRGTEPVSSRQRTALSLPPGSKRPGRSPNTP